MILHLSFGTRLDIVQDIPVGLGWDRLPTKAEWPQIKAEVEKLLGYEIVVWGDFVNPSTKVYWVEVGDVRKNRGWPAPVEFSPEPSSLLARLR